MTDPDPWVGCRWSSSSGTATPGGSIPSARTARRWPAWRRTPRCRTVPGPVDLAMIMVAAPRVAAAVARLCRRRRTGRDHLHERLRRDRPGRCRAPGRRWSPLPAQGGMRMLGPNCIGTVGVGAARWPRSRRCSPVRATTLVAGPVGLRQPERCARVRRGQSWPSSAGSGWAGSSTPATRRTCPRSRSWRHRAEPECRGSSATSSRLDDMAGLRAARPRGIPVAVLKAGRSDAGAKAAASHTGALAATDASSTPRCASSASCGPTTSRSCSTSVTRSGSRAARRADESRSSPRPAARASWRRTPSTRTVSRWRRCPRRRRATLDEIVPAYGSTANPVDVTATVMSDPALFDRALDADRGRPGRRRRSSPASACSPGTTSTRWSSSLARVAERTRQAGAGRPDRRRPPGTGGHRPDCARPASRPTPPRRGRFAPLAASCQVATRAGAASCGVGSASPGPGRVGATRRPARHPRRGRDQEAARCRARHPGARRAGLRTAAEDAARGGRRGGRPRRPQGSRARAAAQDRGWRRRRRTSRRTRRRRRTRRLAALGGDVLVEEMITGGVEALVGIAPSPLGPVLTVGRRRHARPRSWTTSRSGVLPVDLRPTSRRMIDETRLGRAAGRCARRCRRRTATRSCDCVLRAGRARRDWPPGFELDLNPVTVLADGRRCLRPRRGVRPGLPVADHGEV